MWNLFPILTVFTLGLVSPGPDFSIVVKNSLLRGRREGLITTLGIVSGLLFHLSYCIFGLKLMIDTFSSIVIWIHIFGGVYLIYLGYSSFTAPITQYNAPNAVKKSSRSWFLEGLTTNLLNPKAALFLISIFSTVMIDNTVFIASILGLSMMCFAFVWFSIVAFLCSTEVMTKKFYKYEKGVNRLLGLILMGFGVSILLYH